MGISHYLSYKCTINFCVSDPSTIIKTYLETLANLLLRLHTLDSGPVELFLPAVARNVGASTWMNTILSSFASVTLTLVLFLCQPLTGENHYDAPFSTEYEETLFTVSG